MDIRLAVAENLRAIREDRRVSLDTAAQLSGVSKSMLGQIERGEVNPTISVLWRIAEGLRVPFAALIEPPREGIGLVRAADIQPVVEDGGRYQRYPVFAYDAARGFEQHRIVLAPGSCLTAPPHMAGTEESVIVFSGALMITVGEAAYHLGTGDALRFAADVPHAYVCEGDAPAALSMVIHYEGK